MSTCSYYSKIHQCVLNTDILNPITFTIKTVDLQKSHAWIRWGAEHERRCACAVVYQKIMIRYTKACFTTPPKSCRYTKGNKKKWGGNIFLQWLWSRVDFILMFYFLSSCGYYTVTIFKNESFSFVNLHLFVPTYVGRDGISLFKRVFGAEGTNWGSRCDDGRKWIKKCPF